MPDAWDRLLPRMIELHDLGSATRLLYWDQAVTMPPGGSVGRARTMATMGAIAHAKLTDPEVGALLDDLLADDSLDEVKAASVRNLKRDYDKATKVPEDLVRAIARAEGLAYQAWTEARPDDDFGRLKPHLDEMIALKKEEADALGWSDERYDALLDQFEPDATTREIEAVFARLTEGLAPIVDVVLDAAGEPAAFATEPYDEAEQKAFSDWLVTVLGFDMTRGRVDTSPHPFTMTIGAGDIRQTTRTDPHGLLFSVFATLHESGHALYEQGIPEELSDLPAGGAPSLGMHESQSRLWENHVGRGRPFCDFMFEHLKQRFPQLDGVTPDAFHRGANHARRTLIRVTADELTYNLHVALRFELELALFRDELEVADLPGAWNDAMERHVGLRPDTDADGVLQDMHWSIGALGYFPTYTLGTLYAAAFFRCAEADLDDLGADLRAGRCERLLEWLRANIHSKAYLYPGKELAQKITGEPLTVEPFLAHLRTKYGAIYDVAL